MRNTIKKIVLTRGYALAFLTAVIMIVMAAGCADGTDKTDPPGELVQYTVSGTISSEMVVQRNSFFNVFGQSENKGAIIYGEFMCEKRQAVVDENGEWCIQFSPHEATTQEQTLKIYPQNGEVKEFDEILIGDVWIITGQSNAELTMAFALQKNPEYKEEISEDDNIRIFTQTREAVMSVKDKVDLTQAQANIINTRWKWNKTSFSNVNQFSALGYYFAKELSRTVDVPLGIVMAAAGGAVLHELMPANVADELGFTSAPSVPVSGFYNSLLHPFTKNSITGMVFYQGESESCGDQFKTYAKNLQRTVEEYRKIWRLSFPFINVQLSTHMGDSLSLWPQLPEIRAAQFTAYQNIPDSYIVTAMDQAFQAGDPDWAHPYYKLELGKRAASIAAAVVYEKLDINYSLCPVPSKITWEDNSVIIDFKYVGDGLKLLSGDEVSGFTAYDEHGGIAGNSAELVDFNTVKIITTSPAVSVGYGMFPEGTIKKANIGNSSDYPAPAFKIDKDDIDYRIN